ncbi:hypothetical protein MMC11_007417 [Xylographa trunciseda]|nr:hypothetical protein [Xylographa trunciseda]
MKLDPRKATEQELVVLCAGRKPFNADGTRLVMLSEDIIIKFGMGVLPVEAANQHYVYHYVDSNFLRVPQVYRFFQDRTLSPNLIMGYMVMEYIKGTELAVYQQENILSDETMADVVKRIIRALVLLSQIPVPYDLAPGPVEAGEPCGYLWSEIGAGTSFSSMKAKEHWLNERLALHELGKHTELDLTSFRLSMCHTDLPPRNIILMYDGGICFLDWAYAGFYPHLFEIYALRSRLSQEPIFPQILKQLDPPTAEEEMQLKQLALVENINLRFGEVLHM